MRYLLRSLVFTFVLSGIVFFLPGIGNARVHDCDFCHDIHGGSPSIFLLWGSPASIEALCMSCHGPGGSATQVEVHENDPNDSSPDYGVWQITCRECHNPHEGESSACATSAPRTPFCNKCWDTNECNQGVGQPGEGSTGLNIKMVGDQRLDADDVTKIDTPNSGIRHVVFESRGTTVGDPTLHSFCDWDQDSDGYYDSVCDTCHTKTKRHRYTSSRGMYHSHQGGTTCTTSSCHAHIKTFNP